MRDYKHGIYQLPHEFAERLKGLGNKEILGKCLNFTES